MRFNFLLSFLFVYGSCFSSGNTTDTLRKQSRSLIVLPRFNTLNMAPVSGNIVNRHVNFDLSMVYTKNKFMWTIQNGIDLENFHSEMNYFLTNVRYKFSLTKSFSVSPFLAFYSEHAHQIFDPVSDANGGMLFTYQHGLFTVETFVLFVRLTHEKSEKDLINRFEIKYKIKSIAVSGLVYQNTDYFDERTRMAVGFKIILPEFQILHKVNARVEVTGSFKISENPESKNLSGVFLSLAVPIRF